MQGVNEGMRPAPAASCVYLASTGRIPTNKQQERKRAHQPSLFIMCGMCVCSKQDAFVCSAFSESESVIYILSPHTQNVLI